MRDRQPALLHQLACHVLSRFHQELVGRRLSGDVHADHRMVYENILFLCGDALRTANPACDLGLQTTFQLEGFQPLARLTTVWTVLQQCVESGWLIRPGQAAHATNFSLSRRGQAVARVLIERADKAAGPSLSPQQVSLVDAVVRRWAGKPAWDFIPELRRVAAEAYVAATIVPHYDLSDGSLLPFLEAVARARRQADGLGEIRS